MILKVTRGVLNAMRDAARHTHPEECCGLLFGSGDRIETLTPARNVAAERSRHFEIDPAALLSAFKAMRTGGPEVVGYYHSHPTGDCVPSATDREHSTGDSRIWAIISAGEVAFWRDSANGFDALPFSVVE